MYTLYKYIHCIYALYVLYIYTLYTYDINTYIYIYT